MKTNSLRPLVFSGVFLLFISNALGDAPVIDANALKEEEGAVLIADAADEKLVALPEAEQQTANALGNESPASEEKLQRLSQQVNNIVDLNLPQQIVLLQQQVAQLRGQLEVQAHDLQAYNQQLRSFYQDLDQRVSQLGKLNKTANLASQTNALPANASNELRDANAYQEAFTQLVNHQLDRSQKSFTQYLIKYPGGKYGADAHYWLGEIYLTNKNYPQAAAEFATVLNNYATSSKAIDATLKIAIIHANTGKVEEAKRELLAIKNTHPNSTAAQLASIRLQQLEVE